MLEAMATEADVILADALLADAEAHSAGRDGEIGERYDDVYAELLPLDGLSERPVRTRACGRTDSRSHSECRLGGGRADRTSRPTSAPNDQFSRGASPASATLAAALDVTFSETAELRGTGRRLSGRVDRGNDHTSVSRSHPPGRVPRSLCSW